MDALSRLAKIPASKRYAQDEEYGREVTLQELKVALLVEEIKEVSFQEEELEAVPVALERGHLRKAPKAYELASQVLACIGQVVL